MEERDDGVAVPAIPGISEALEFVSALTDEVAEYRAFAEDVLLACAMPDVPRFSVEHDDSIPFIHDAAGMLFNRMTEYRKMVAWFRANNIDLDAILGREGKDKKKKRN